MSSPDETIRRQEFEILNLKEVIENMRLELSNEKRKNEMLTIQLTYANKQIQLDKTITTKNRDFFLTDSLEWYERPDDYVNVERQRSPSSCMYDDEIESVIIEEELH
jgi:hypothetical protein